MFAWLKRLFVGPSDKGEVEALSYRQANAIVAQSPSDDHVIVPLNPLIWLLGARERQKGAPLTREEVLAVRDDAKCLIMPRDRAKTFYTVYTVLDAQAPVPRIDPERCWDEWQKIRHDIDRFMPG